MKINKLNVGGTFAASVLSLLLVASPGVSQATAMYSGDVSLELQLVGAQPIDLDILVDAGTEVFDDSTATATGAMLSSNPFGFNVHVEGTANPGTSVASSYSYSDASIVLGNTSNADYDLEFSYVFSYTGTATADVLGDTATISTLLSMSGLQADYWGFTLDFAENTNQDGPALSYNATGSFTMFLADGDAEELSISLGADGIATSVATEVPSPSALLLMMPGLMMVGWSRSKK